MNEAIESGSPWTLDLFRQQIRVSKDVPVDRAGLSPEAYAKRRTYFREYWRRKQAEMGRVVKTRV